eukprot:762585-Hanusia_phi.AAC.3
MLDYIPMLEVVQVHRTSEVRTSDLNSKSVFTTKPYKAKSVISKPRVELKVTSVPMLDDDDEELCILTIFTLEDGHNSGRPTVLSTPDKSLYNDVVRCLEAAVERCKAEALARSETSALSKWRRRVGKFYDGNLCQGIVGALIVASYVNALVNAQVLPEASSAQSKAFSTMEWFFNISFTVVRGRGWFTRREKEGGGRGW